MTRAGRRSCIDGEDGGESGVVGVPNDRNALRPRPGSDRHPASGRHADDEAPCALDKLHGTDGQGGVHVVHPRPHCAALERGVLEREQVALVAGVEPYPDLRVSLHLGPVKPGGVQIVEVAVSVLEGEHRLGGIDWEVPFRPTVAEAQRSALVTGGVEAHPFGSGRLHEGSDAERRLDHDRRARHQ